MVEPNEINTNGGCHIFVLFVQKPKGRINPYPSLMQQIFNVVLDFPVLTGGGGGGV